MRLIDVQTARQANGDRTAATKAPSTPCTAAWSAALAAGYEAFALGAFAKFLDAILQIVFASCTEILRAPLGAVDADGFGGAVGSRAVQGQSCDVPGGGAAPLAGAGRAECATGERGQSA